ncbi:unnamed protein product [Lasius platythorax]|uniref:Uncharacterized protein n=1 Tax=Lasius platythorax TaxID=488582 RepID=A0AAV2NZR5_9HYME
MSFCGVPPCADNKKQPEDVDGVQKRRTTMHPGEAAASASFPRPTPTPGQSHRNFFPATSNTEVIEAAVETYLFPADYKSFVNSSFWRRGSRVLFLRER